MATHIPTIPHFSKSTKPTDRVVRKGSLPGIAKGGPRGQTKSMDSGMCSAKEMEAPGPAPKKL